MTLQKRLDSMFSIVSLVLCFPVLTLVLSTVIACLNFRVGYQHYTLINLLFCYLAFLVILPVVGIITLFMAIWLTYRIKETMTQEELYARKKVLIVATLAILLDPLWIVCLPYIFFSLGGIR